MLPRNVSAAVVAAPAPTGEYRVAECAGDHLVFYVRDHTEWWQQIASFPSRDRADDYAEIENGLMEDFEDDPHRHGDAKSDAPKLLAPPSSITPEIFRPARKAPERLIDIQNEAAAAPPPASAIPAAPAPPKPGKPRVRRRFTTNFDSDPTKVNGLPPDHPAITGARTLFPKSVKDPADVARVLVSGINSRKLGDRVVKGPWSGMPIYHLTLEERATCPESCFNWSVCYGNGMPHARRHVHGDELVKALDVELQALNRQHRHGFVVRLHTLGDFYSVDYVDYWKRALKDFPALHVFGYTARLPGDDKIGDALFLLTDQWDRFAIRFSFDHGFPQGATTIFRKPEGPVVEEGIVCPAETGQTECCGTCGLCWAPAARDKCIVFVAHGQTFTDAAADHAAGDLDILTARQDKVWRTLATIISETGLSPSYTVLGRAAGTGIVNPSVMALVNNLVAKGYVEKMGNRRSTTLHLLKWPDGVSPRLTVGRADMAAPVSQAEVARTAPPGDAESKDGEWWNRESPADADPRDEARPNADQVQRRCTACLKVFMPAKLFDRICPPCRRAIAPAHG